MKPFNNGSGKSIYVKQNYKTNSELNNNDVEILLAIEQKCIS